MDCLREATRGEVHALLVLSNDDTKNLLVAHAAVRQGIDHIIALVNDPARLADFRNLGVQTYTPTIFRPALLALMARSPDIFQLLTRTDDEQDVREVYLRNPLGDGQPLHSLGLPGNLLILSIGRNGDLLIPHGNTRLELGDRLTLLGDIDDLQSAVGWLDTPHPG